MSAFDQIGFPVPITSALIHDFRTIIDIDTIEYFCTSGFDAAAIATFAIDAQVLVKLTAPALVFPDVLVDSVWPEITLFSD